MSEEKEDSRLAVVTQTGQYADAVAELFGSIFREVSDIAAKIGDDVAEAVIANGGTEDGAALLALVAMTEAARSLTDSIGEFIRDSDWAAR